MIGCSICDLHMKSIAFPTGRLGLGTMNEKLEAFRKRLNLSKTAQPKTAMMLKDWLSIFFSLSAFMISILTTYINVISKTDEVRVLVERLPEVDLSKKRVFDDNLGADAQFIVKPEAKLTFINSGNRKAIVTGVSVQLDQPTEGTPRPLNCDKTMGNGDPLALDAFVIEPSDIVPVTLAGDEVIRLGVGSFNMRPENHSALLCLVFSVTTPTSAGQYQFPMFRITFPNSVNHLQGVDRVPLYKEGIPIVLFKRSGTIFSD